MNLRFSFSCRALAQNRVVNGPLCVELPENFEPMLALQT